MHPESGFWIYSNCIAVFFFGPIFFNRVEGVKYEMSDASGRLICLLQTNVEPLDELNTTFRTTGSNFFFIPIPEIALNCTADLPMDFSFDGQSPNGDGLVFYSSQIYMNTTKETKYVMHLFLLATPDAQLTGNYSVFLVEKPDHRTSIYVFHEKAPYLFQANGKITKENGILVIPCRSTIPKADISLYKRSMSTDLVGIDRIVSSEYIKYDPKIGFMWNTTGYTVEERKAYICKTNISNDSLEWSLGNLEDSGMEETNSSARIEFTVRNGQVGIKCVRGSSNVYLSNVQDRNPRSLRLSAGCAPQGQVCPGRKREGIRLVDSWTEFKSAIDFAFPYGLAFCSEQGRTRTITKDYFLGVDDNMYFNWEHARDSNAILKISSMNHSLLYSNMTYTFTCTYQNFILMSPILFSHHFKNGSVVDNGNIELQGDKLAVYSVTLFSDIRRVSCSASLWNSSVLINSSMDMNLRDKFAPDFEVKETSTTLNLNATNQHLRCVAIGDDLPDISWEKDGVEITDDLGIEIVPNPGSSSLNFPTIRHEHSGTYECVARNSIGTARKRFRVDVVDPESSNYEVVLGIPLGLLAVLIVTILASYLFIKHFYKHRLYLTKAEIEEFKEGCPSPSSTDDPEKLMQNIQCGPYNNDYEIDTTQFQIDKSSILGSGQFGIVYKGLYNHLPVAVKTVRPHVEKAYLKALLSELKVMIYINGHKNIINLIGANTESLKSGIVYVFLELCGIGSLEGFLRSHQHNFINQITPQGSMKIDSRQYSNIQNRADTICTRDLILWSFQISSAMEYLASKNVIHGDLATRNVLLADRNTVKITDFGLAKKLYNYATYEKKNQAPLPWRWMAIESLRSLTFSTKSDVWAFGVTLWEIFTLGDVPYPGLSWTINFVKELQNNLRMTQPRNACSGIYDVMLTCWERNPDDRPTFGSLSEYFSEYLLKFRTVKV